MTIEELLEQARSIWADKTMSLEEITIALGVVYGDICRQARTRQEGKSISDTEPQKELGNLIFSSIRWCQELGYDPIVCLELAIQAQSRYARHR